MATRVSSPVFVGRNDLLRQAHDVLDAVHNGAPEILLITGEAGVGKTRFLNELARSAREQGDFVLEGGCAQIGAESLPFGPFVEALRVLAHQVEQSDLDDLLGLGRSELSRLLPQLSRPGDDLRGPATDPSAQARLFEHLLGLLQRLASRAPVVLSVEDIHWADRSTLELIGFLVRNLRHGRILLIATCRSDELGTRPSLAALLGEFDRSGRVDRITLGPFDHAETAALARAILGAGPPAELVGRIHRRSGGNAFYAEELLAAPDHVTLPDSLRAALLARVAALSDETQEFIRAAAVGGAVVDPALLRATTGLPADRLMAVLREAVRAGVLVPLESSVGERYAFRHALVQEAVYGELLPGERRRMHAAFAAALSETHQDRPTAAAEIAHHWHAAHDLPRAFDASIAAGLAAERMAAFAEASDSFSRAVEIWPELPDAAQRSTIDRIDLLARAAVAIDLVDQGSGRARELVEQAIQLVDPATDPVRAASLYERLGQYCIGVSDVDGARLAYEQAMSLVPAEPPSAVRAWVLSGFAHYFAVTGDAASSLPLGREAVRVARAAGAVDAELRALVPLGSSLVLLGQVEEGLATLRNARSLGLEVGSVPDVARAGTWLAAALYNAGRDLEALEMAVEAARYAIEHGLAARWAPAVLPLAADLLISLGRWSEVEPMLARAAAHSRDTPADVLVIETRLMWLESLRGDLDAAERHAPAVMASAGSFAGGLSAFEGPAEFGLWSGDPLISRRVIDQAWPLLDVARPLVRWMGSALWLGLRAEADIATDARARRADAEVAEARRIGAEFRDRLEALVAEVAVERTYFTPMVRPWAMLCDGEWTRLEGASDPDAWAAASEGQAEPYLRAYALWREGEASLAIERRGARAAGALAEARAIAVDLGAEILRRQVELLMALAPGRRAPRALDAAKSAPGRFDLTAREREVLALLADGRSDAEIGDALFISKKTASVHVTNIKDKLGAQSRVEIVLTAMRRGLVDAPEGPAG